MFQERMVLVVATGICRFSQARTLGRASSLDNLHTLLNLSVSRSSRELTIIRGFILDRRPTKNKARTNGVCLVLVEATGLEPTTFWSLTKRATKLRYASICMPCHGFPRLTA